MKKIVIIIAPALLLSGCGVYTKYQRPAVASDRLYRTEIGADTTASLAQLRWDELFTDPQLQTLVREGLEANTDLRIARLKVEEAQASLRTARLAYLPSVQADASGTLSGFDGGAATKTYSLGGSASWEIDIFGKLTGAKRGAAAALEESEAYRQAVRTQLIATVAGSYYTLLLLDGQRTVTEETLGSWDEYIRTLRGLMRAGEADRATVEQAEAGRLAVQNSLHDILRQISETENSLSALLGRMPGSIERGTLDGSGFPQELSVGVPLELLTARPDIRQAEAVLKQRFYMTAQARAAFYPGITLSGSVGWTNNGAVIADPKGWLWQAVGSLVQPLFNKGKNRANLKIAKAQQEEALLSFRQTLLDAGVEVNDAVTQWQTARTRVGVDRKRIEHLQQVVDDTRLLMRHGNINYLQVLTARQSLLSAQLELLADRKAEIQSVIDLYHALGGGQ